MSDNLKGCVYDLGAVTIFLMIVYFLLLDYGPCLALLEKKHYLIPKITNKWKEKVYRFILEIDLYLFTYNKSIKIKL